MYPVLSAAAIVVMVARIVSTYGVFNDTIDEPYHIGAGIGLYEARKHIHGVQHPPLPRLVGALPLVLSGVGSPQDRGIKTVQIDLVAFQVGHAALLRSELPYWSVLTRARAAMLVFPIAAIIYVYLLGRYLGGGAVGCAAAVFFSTDPTLLGHSSWVTTDVAATAGFLAATYHGLRFLAHASWGRAAAAGLALGAALACKFSCALVVPALLLVALVRWRATLRRWPGRLALAGLAIVCAFVTLWAAYLFDIGRMEDSLALRNTPQWEAFPDWLKRTAIPMPSLLIGYLELSQHADLGHRAYLNGELSLAGWWHYFPEALLLKSPVALLLAMAIAFLTLFVGRSVRSAMRRIFSMRCLALHIPLGVFFITAMSAGINIGIRHVLPAIPLIYLLIVLQLIRAKLAPILTGLIALAAVETAMVHPDYLAYFNVLAGGPSGGERYLLDSNLDWGQDLARLKQWLEENGRGREVTLRLFGNPRLREWPHDDAAYTILPPGQPPRGLLAISKNITHDLYPVLYGGGPNQPPRAERPIPGLARMRPIARIGCSIDLYDLDQPAR
jgi:hypothetical protein